MHCVSLKLRRGELYFVYSHQMDGPYNHGLERQTYQSKENWLFKDSKGLHQATKDKRVEKTWLFLYFMIKFRVVPFLCNMNRDSSGTS